MTKPENAARRDYYRQMKRQREGYVKRYARWPKAWPETKREEVRRIARERGEPLEQVQRELGIVA